MPATTEHVQPTIKISESAPTTDGVRTFLLEASDEQVIASISLIERHNVNLYDEAKRFEQLPGASILTNGQIADALSHLVSQLNYQRTQRNLAP